MQGKKPHACMPPAPGTHSPSLGTYLSPLEIKALFLPGSPALRQAWLDLSQSSLHVLQLHLPVLSQLGCFYSLRGAGEEGEDCMPKPGVYSS